jgi:SH3-like domain-containing protein
MDEREIGDRVAAHVREIAGGVDRRFERIEAAARLSEGRTELGGFASSASLLEALLALLERDGIHAESRGMLVAGGPAAARERVVVSALVHLRADPTHRSEMLTQSVLGESLEILVERGGWALARAFDGYLGWVGGPGLAEPCREYLALRDANPTLRVTVREAVLRERPAPDGLPIRRAPFDSRLVLSDIEEAWRRVLLADGTAGWIGAEEAVAEREMPRYPTTGRIVERGMEMVGVPYLWGGTTPLGFDCSGLVQRLYGHFGILLPRDADLQKRAVEGDWIGSDAKEGDLLFFGGERPEHVAISLGGTDFLHASGWVRVQSLDPRSPRARSDLSAIFLGGGRLSLLARPR